MTFTSLAGGTPGILALTQMQLVTTAMAVEALMDTMKQLSSAERAALDPTPDQTSVLARLTNVFFGLGALSDAVTALQKDVERADTPTRTGFSLIELAAIPTFAQKVGKLAGVEGTSLADVAEKLREQNDARGLTGKTAKTKKVPIGEAPADKLDPSARSPFDAFMADLKQAAQQMGIDTGSAEADECGCENCQEARQKIEDLEEFAKANGMEPVEEADMPPELRKLMDMMRSQGIEVQGRAYRKSAKN